MSKNNLKQKAVSGIFWSFSENAINQSAHFFVGIILARLLSPAEFGLIGMITVFIAISQSLIDSGFQQALIRDKEAKNIDFSTVFYFNILLGTIFYFILFALAQKISIFYNEPQLTKIIKIFGLTLIIDSLAIVQRAKLIREINFKLQTKISLISAVFSGAIAISLAFNGFGVWSLVGRALVNQFLQALLYWNLNKWKPTFEFSFESFRRMFAFGSKLLISGLINTVYRNIYLLIIGKYFSSSDLGYFTRAEHFSKLPSNNIMSTIQKVSYPVLSIVQDEPRKLKEGYRKIIKTTMFISFAGMLGMAAVSKPMILALIGDKWSQSITYLQLLCIAGMLYPLHSLNLNILNVKGRSDLFLKLEIIKKILAIPVIIIGILISIKAFIIGMIINSFIAYFINSFYSGQLINYPMKEQILDILPSFFISLVVSTLVYIPSLLLDYNPWVMLIFQIITGLLLTMFISGRMNIEGYLDIKAIITEKSKVFLKRSN